MWHFQKHNTTIGSNIYKKQNYKLNELVRWPFRQLTPNKNEILKYWDITVFLTN
jgi:hypothetical protein